MHCAEIMTATLYAQIETQRLVEKLKKVTNTRQLQTYHSAALFLHTAALL